MYLDSLDGGKDFLKRRCKVLTIKEKKKKGIHQETLLIFIGEASDTEKMFTTQI